MKTKEVKVNSNEYEKFEELNAKLDVIYHEKDLIVERLEKLFQEKRLFWNELYQKYDLDTSKKYDYETSSKTLKISDENIKGE
jgi:hypothetical protein